jgi:tRNA threonylcarbamoyladenosine biosynthesis protein TsaB
MRVLGIETSSRLGSVALAEGGRVVATRQYEQSGRHAERILPLIAEVLEEAGWQRSTLQRLAVGTGPGSFTGLRVGISLVQGIALGLGVPAVGVGSLRALAFSVPSEVLGTRVAVIDARRSEVFVATYDELGAELHAPCALARNAVAGFLGGLTGPYVCVGEVARELGLDVASATPQGSNLPHAAEVARLAAIVEDRPQATYVHGPGVTPAPMPPSPFARPLADGD